MGPGIILARDLYYPDFLPAKFLSNIEDGFAVYGILKIDLNVNPVLKTIWLGDGNMP